MVERRYGDNAEAASAQGSNNLLKRFGQRKTTQTSKTRLNSTLTYGMKNGRKQDGRRFWLCACSLCPRVCVCAKEKSAHMHMRVCEYV